VPILTNDTASPDWIIIEDEEVTADGLAAVVAQRLAERRAQLGQPPSLNLPAFGYLSPLPETPQQPVSATLYHHLRHLNELGAPETTPVLVPSPATRVPILGRFWRTIRAQMHQLILFYVNRALAHETAVTNHTRSTLNELTRLAQAQQEEINRLQQEIERLQEEQTHD
jgi:hypothetical protein